MKAPIEWFVEDDQVRDALRIIEHRRRLELHNAVWLRVLCAMIGVSWLAVLLHSLWRWW